MVLGLIRVWWVLLIDRFHAKFRHHKKRKRFPRGETRQNVKIARITLHQRLFLRVQVFQLGRHVYLRGILSYLKTDFGFRTCPNSRFQFSAPPLIYILHFFSSSKFFISHVLKLKKHLKNKKNCLIKICDFVNKNWFQTKTKMFNYSPGS